MYKKMINTLIRLASADGLMAEKEARFIKMIAKARGVSDEEVEEMIKNPQPMEDLNTLSDDQKFEYIYTLVQLMKTDGQVFKSEIAFCEKVAEELGYKKKVIGELSSRIYSDPAITADREKLKERAQKYLN
ncbi:MAG TPA: TerB family tellurite resistance protein [Flammeovirgaceae bacterium]|nr:TerB family tellurite resistance protein [Flammeovirgaceae bacterium]